MSSKVLSAEAFPAPEIPVRITSSLFAFFLRLPLPLSRLWPAPNVERGGLMRSSYTYSAGFPPTETLVWVPEIKELQPTPSDRRAADEARIDRPRGYGKSTDHGRETQRLG